MRNFIHLSVMMCLRSNVIKFLVVLILVQASVFSEERGKFESFVWSSSEMNGKVYEKAVILVPVTMAGNSQKLYAQLDTGADLTILYGRIMRKLGIPVDSAKSDAPPFRWYGHDREAGPLEEAEIINWTMDADINLESGNRDFYVIGTIGLDKVIGKVLVLDFPGERFAVLNDTAEIKKLLPAKVSYVDGTVSYNKFYVNIQLGKDTINAVRYDCGSSMSTLILPLDWWQWATGLEGDEPEVVKDSVISWGEYVDILTAPAQYDMVFADILLKNPEVMTVDWPDPTLAQTKLMGNAPFFDSLVVIVDCIREKFGICRGF
ncbi:MAG: hypothetical protein ACOYVF_10355 [Candidatus Zixiibacteriota bacterium]